MRKFLRLMKRVSNKTVGTLSDVLFWKFRHLFDKNWSENYISEESLNHPHRKMLVDAILKYEPENVLEIGCASGPNLVLLSRKLTGSKLTGIDISEKAIETGRKYFQSKNIENVKLEVGNVLDLKKFPDKSFDVVFTDATLIYVDKNKIESVLKEITRITKKAVILNEWHTEGGNSLYRDHWVHDYKTIFKKTLPDSEINLVKIPAEIWSGEWAKYGYITEVKLNNKKS